MWSILVSSATTKRSSFESRTFPRSLSPKLFTTNGGLGTVEGVVDCGFGFCAKRLVKFTIKLTVLPGVEFHSADQYTLCRRSSLPPPRNVAHPCGADSPHRPAVDE